MGDYGDWVEAEVGTRTHSVIAYLADRSRPGPGRPASATRPTPAAVLAACAGDLEWNPIENRVRRRAVLLGVRSCVNVYVGVAWPGDGWHCIGSELPVGNRRADLVFKHTSGAVVIDELKTGEAPRPGDPQVADLLAGGRSFYGEALLGVRVVPLAAISAMWLACPDGSVRHLGGPEEAA